MSGEYDHLKRHLKTLLSENGVTLEIISVQNARCPETMIEVHAICHEDPVLFPEDDEELESGIDGRRTDREVTLVVTLPCDTDGSITAKITFATTEADDGGNRRVSFHWVFDATGSVWLAEMQFSDDKTFKLDYFSVLPPDYVRDFVALCEQGYNEVI